MENESLKNMLLLTLERIDNCVYLVNVKASLVLPANAVLLGFLLQGYDKYFKFLKGTSIYWFTKLTFLFNLGRFRSPPPVICASP